MNVATATPAEIDTEIARIEGAKAAVQGRIADAEQTIRRFENSSLYLDRVEQAKGRIPALTADVMRLTAEVAPLHREYDRRGGWTRYYLVDANNGHVHPHRACSTCYASTQYFWLTSESGKTDAEVVETAGERACTVCFPDAPVEIRNRPTGYLRPSEVEAAARRAEREQKAAEKAAKKAAAAIVGADGETLRTWSREVKTEREAVSEYREAIAYLTYALDDEAVAANRMANQTEDEHLDNIAHYVGLYLPIAVSFGEALAAKHGVPVGDEVDAHAKPIAAKVRKDAKEAAEFRKQYARMF